MFNGELAGADDQRVLTSSMQGRKDSDAEGQADNPRGSVTRRAS